MTAEGNVEIEGQSPKQGQFSAMAERVSYTQQKEQLILEGNNRVPATISPQRSRDGTADRQFGRVRSSTTGSPGQAEWDTVRSFEFTPAASGGSLRTHSVAGRAAALAQ